MNTVFSKNYKFFITVFITVLCFLTTLISVGFGALNKDIKIAGTVEYTEDAGNMMKKYTSSTTTDFHSSTYKDLIKTVDFLDNKTIPGTAVVSWDVSVNNDGRVMAWLINDPNNSGYYKLYVGSDGDVVGNPDSGYMFYGLSELETINFNNNFDTSKVTKMAYMFRIYVGGSFYDGADYKNKLTQINGLNNYNTSQVTTMSGMFSACDKLTSIDLSSFDTSKVTNMSSMFQACNNLTSLDVTSFNTSQVTDMSDMFYYCNSLVSLDVTNFNTSSVNTGSNTSGGLRSMFNGCTNLTSLNLSNFDTSQVKSMGYMFRGCKSLTSLNLSNFDTSQVKYMHYMFFQCNNLTSLNLSSFDTSQVTSMSNMFASCNKVTSLNLTSFDTSQVTDMTSMFSNNYVLTQISISSLWNVSNVTNSNNMFAMCTRLPNFNSSSIDVSMAKPTTQGGYLTLV